MSQTDVQTGIHNRRQFDIRLQDGCERQRRYPGDLSIIVIGIDGLEELSDIHGPECGEYVLERVAAGIAGLMRKSDCLARFSPDTLCCLVFDSGGNTANKIAERLRRHVENLELQFHDADLKVTASLGISGSAQAASPETMLGKAVEALSLARQAGGNRVAARPGAENPGLLTRTPHLSAGHSGR